MSPLFWVTTLLFVGLFVMVLEVFIPSGGLLGFVSIAAIVAAIATAFAEQGIGPGFLVLAITAVAVPATLALAFHLFPIDAAGSSNYAISTGATGFGSGSKTKRPIEGACRQSRSGSNRPCAVGAGGGFK